MYEEACKFRDDIFTLNQMDAQVVGVSLDDSASHAQFAKNTAAVPLLADPRRGHAQLWRAAAGQPLRQALHLPHRSAARWPSLYQRETSRHSVEVIEDLSACRSDDRAPTDAAPLAGSLPSLALHARRFRIRSAGPSRRFVLRRAARWLATLALALAPLFASAFDLQAIAARGGLARRYPAAFAAALSLGVSTLELDTAITRTACGVSHDARLIRTLPRHRRRWLNPPTRAVRELMLEDWTLRRRPDQARQRLQRRFPTRSAWTRCTCRRWPRYSSSRAAPATLTCASASRSRPRRKSPGTRSRRRRSPKRCWDDRTRRHGSRVIIQSFDWRALQACRRCRRPSRPAT